MCIDKKKKNFLPLSFLGEANAQFLFMHAYVHARANLAAVILTAFLGIAKNLECFSNQLELCIGLGLFLISLVTIYTDVNEKRWTGRREGDI